MGKQPQSWANCHAIFKKALQAAPETEHPPPPYHQGGPQPTCPSLDQIGLAIWCAQVLRPTLQPGESAAYKKLLALAGAFVESSAGRELYEKLSAASRPESSKESPALSCARNACGGSASYARGKADLVFTAAGAALNKLVKHLVAHPGSLAGGAPRTARELLLWLDAEIVRLECAGAMTERARKPVAVKQVLWRGADGKGKKAAHFLAAIDEGTWGLVTRLGRNWSFVEGPPDHVLANVPDPLFQTVSAAARVAYPGL